MLTADWVQCTAPAPKVRAAAQRRRANEEVLPNFDVTGWYGLLAPAGTPVAIVNRLNAELNRALRTAAVQERLAFLGADALPGSPAQFATLIESETTRWTAVIHRLGLKPD